MSEVDDAVQAVPVGPVPVSYRVLAVPMPEEMGTYVALEQTTQTGVFVTFWSPESALNLSDMLRGAAKEADNTSPLIVPEPGLVVPFQKRQS